MKWSEYYKEISLSDENEVEGCTGPVALMMSIARHKPISAHLITVDMFDDEGEFDEDAFEAQETIKLIVTSIVASKKSGSAIFQIELIGDLLPGLRRGDYTLIMNDDGRCTELPAEMFEEEDEPCPH